MAKFPALWRSPKLCALFFVPQVFIPINGH
jgi:hypothetical protein